MLADHHLADPAEGRPPPGLAPTERLVGRPSELAELERALAEVPSTVGPVRLLRGPAGIGKTRLAEELARRAAAAGVIVAWAHCPDAVAAPPYWPWTQVVRTLTGRVRGTGLADHVLEDPDGADRFDLFDATVSAVRGAADGHPVLVVLDDLHAADEDSLQLTRFLAQQVRDVPLLLVATVRTAADTTPGVPEHLDALARWGSEQHLGGLDVAGVGELLDDRARAPEVHAVTGGNPLHVQQLVQELQGPAAQAADAGSDPDEALRRTVARRVDGVRGPTRAVLDAAAVLGSPFSLDELVALVGWTAGAVVPELGRLASEGFLHLDGNSTFRHPLVVDAVLGALGDDDRHRLHRRAAELVACGDERASEHAHHLLAAGPARRLDAVAACRRAGRLATRALAHEDAVAHHSRAHEALDDGDDTSLRLDVLHELGAALWRAGRTAEADAAYESAWQEARRSGDADAQARAVLRNGLEYYFADGARPEVSARVEAALASRSSEPSAITTRLLAELACHHLASTVDEGRRLAADALAMAREIDDPLALGCALIARQVSDLGPATLRRRIADAHELMACAREAEDYRLGIHGRFLLTVALLEAGDIRALDGVLARQHDVTENLGEPRFSRFVMWLQATRALFAGDVASAEALADQTFEISSRLGDPDALGVHGGQLGVIRWMQGRVLEMEPVYVAMQADEPHEPLWPAVLAWLWATHGHPDAARGALSLVPDPGEVPSGMHWLLTATTYAEAAALVGTDDQVDRAWAALLPYVDRTVPVAMGAAVWGTVAKPLGRLALRRGDVDEGLTHLRTAVRACARLGARPWLAEAQFDLADALDRHRPGDPTAPALRAEAAEVVRRLDLRVFADRLDVAPVGAPAAGVGAGTLMLRAAESPPEPAGPTAVDGRPSIRVIGGFEVVAGDGTVARWSSRKARELLKILVSRRGVPVGREELMDLLWPDEDPTVLANRLSVALSTIRRALDPERDHGAGAFVSTGADVVVLDVGAVDVDVEELLDGARPLLGPAVDGDAAATAARAGELLDRFRGEALPDEPHAEWAGPLRSEVRMVVIALARLVAGRAEADGDHLRAAEAHRRVLDLDPYDEPAHLGLTAAFRAMGAHGQAVAAYGAYQQRMRDLGVPVAPER